MSEKALFRKAALDRLASPERLDVLMHVTSARDWIAVAVTAGLIAAIVAWSVLGTIPTRVVGEGILIRGGGLREIRAAGDGLLTGLRIHLDDTVQPDQVVGVISGGTGVDESIKSARGRYEQAARDYNASRAEDQATIDGLRATIAGHLADVERAQAELARANDDLAAKREALKKGLIVSSRVQAIERDVVSLQSTITGLRANINNVQATIRGTEQRLRAKAAEVDAARMNLEQLTAAAKETSQVVSTVGGRVVELKRAAGDRVHNGEVLAVVEPVSSTLEPVVFVDSAVGKRIKPGMEAEISPSTVKREEYGFMRGKVRSVGDYPVTPEAVAAIVPNSALVQEFLGPSSKLELRAALIPDPATRSEYKWSSSSGPPFKVDAGTRVIVSIVVERRAPISYVLPLLRGTLGTT